MRKITVFILFLIVLIWLAVAVFWTGNGSNQITVPDNNSPILLPQETPTVSTISAVLATPSGTPTSSLKY